MRRVLIGLSVAAALCFVGQAYLSSFRAAAAKEQMKQAAFAKKVFPQAPRPADAKADGSRVGPPTQAQAEAWKLRDRAQKMAARHPAYHPR